MPSCFEDPCPAANVPAGAGPQAGCLGVHAEISALINWPPGKKLKVCYCNKMPCNSCVLALLSTSCERIVCRIPANDKTGMEMWVAAGRGLVVMDG
jgi:deoxycytidylate deaminase